MRLRHKPALIVFINLYLPKNSGLERFNYLALRQFNRRSIRIKLVRGEDIPELIDREGGYGWTGNDLFYNYLASGRPRGISLVSFMAWPEEIRPHLCLLGPSERDLEQFQDKIISLVAPNKYFYLVKSYLADKEWDYSIEFLDGQVEKQIRKGQADLAIDIVYTGKTSREEKLKSIIKELRTAVYQ